MRFLSESPVGVAYIPLSCDEREPMTYQQAMSSKYRYVWVNAMKAEFKGLQLSGTFNDDLKPDNREAVSSH